MKVLRFIVRPYFRKFLFVIGVIRTILNFLDYFIMCIYRACLGFKVYFDILRD